jgi:hypothetical protein
MNKNAFGVWEVVVSAVDGQPAIPHNSKIKVLQANFDPTCTTPTNVLSIISDRPDYTQWPED